ncbi:Hint domain-containing protein [Pelagimonas varians]|uniref:Hedgehog/Intein (Hint) domain-containing protein n=1 Tax=Pelagimonas varians TaxID=696760 RepID=A0A238KAY1_9RHOB|nr:Hint domain-containing protein [Pelagimonas varians]PYG31120.1 Hint domain-containing protein [Pelagimonas varians]SMX39677.1 hypothetical protein PEV8663_01818 [Pelagimonas varians]
MSWIALSGQGKSWVCPRTFDGSVKLHASLVSRGSIVIETRSGPDDRPHSLLSYARSEPWVGGISIQVLSGGAIGVNVTQGAKVFEAAAKYNPLAQDEAVRVTFSWDCARGFGQIAVERPTGQTVEVTTTTAPPPMLLEDLRNLVQRRHLVSIDPDVAFFAVSDAIEPVGPMPSLLAQVPVLTPTGYRPVADLQCGDTVKTRTSGVVPVLHRVSRVVPALGSFQPVRLRAPYFGLKRDVLVAPHQRLVIGGSDVEYIFGRDAVLVPAMSLVNGFAAAFEDGLQMVEYHQLLLPGNEPVIAAGTELESLYVGQLRRRAGPLRQSLLSQVPRNLVPEHTSTGLKVLGAFEAMTLADARAA